jgi:hypothetical protein
LVLIPHASTERPPEIKREWLSKNQRQLLYSDSSETDRGSERIYDLKSVIGCEQLIFPYSQVYLNACRHPDVIEQICPVSIRGTVVYKTGREPSPDFRRKLVRKHVEPFFKRVGKFKGKLILNGHTTIAGHSSMEEELNYDIFVYDQGMIRGRKRIFAPNGLVERYATELRQRLPRLRIGVNPPLYVDVYDRFCYDFGWRRSGGGIPTIHQETDEGLYIKNNRMIPAKVRQLRNAFAESLRAVADTL